MTIRPKTPQIDQRRRTEIASQMRYFINCYLGGLWPTDESILKDPKLNAVVNIFSRFMEITLGKINGAARKNFLAFLETLGFTLNAPRPARTALEFKLVKKARQNWIIVPQSTQVTGNGTDGEPVFFETENRLTVVTPELCDIRSIAASYDRTSNHTENFLGNKERIPHKLFTGEELIPHRLYIGDDRLFSFDKPSDITLEITIEEKGVIPSFLGPDGGNLIEWYAFTEDAAKKDAKPVSDYEETSDDFQRITPIALNENGTVIGDQPEKWEAINLLRKGKTRLVFKNIAQIPIKKVRGFISEKSPVQEWQAPWIIAELKKPLIDITFPKIKSIKASSQLAQKEIDGNQYLPDKTFYNNIELDCTKDFYPFGDRPKLSDAFYLANEFVFEKEGAIVTIECEISNGIEKVQANGIELLWEYFDNQKWNRFNVVKGFDCISNPGDLFNENPEFGKVEGKFCVKFMCPNIPVSMVNGNENRWIRVRLAAGNYGRAATYEERVIPGYYLTSKTEEGELGKITSDGTVEKLSVNDRIIYMHISETYAPPVFGVLTLSFEMEPQPVNTVLSYNNYFFREIEREFGEDKKGIYPFITYEKDSTEIQNALYLAFNSSISGLPLSLLFPLEARESMIWSPHSSPPNIIWEYWNGDQWSEIAVNDPTRNLTRREIIQCPIPEDAKPVACFRKQLYWIRARLIEGQFPVIPQVKGIYLNAVWARHQTTIKKQIWGSSTGAPSQQVPIPVTSLLDECSISIRETGISDEQAQQIMEECGADAVENVTVDALGNVTERWIRWQQVDNFYGSLPDSRHYVIDRSKNVILFGDGKNGMIPPRGRDSIRCDFCRFGGGASGNVEAGSLTKLCTSIPYIDSVNNPIAAEGGAELETYEMLEQRATYSLRNRGRAVTASDFEALIKSASDKVARVKCLPITDPMKIKKPGWVTALIVPVGDDIRPVPSMDLFDTITCYLESRYAANLCWSTPAPVNLIAPFYVKVKAKITAFSVSAGDVAYVKQLVDKRIRRYFHANHVGFDEQGWEFGRNVYKSEIFQVIESISEVDHVHSVSLQSNVQMLEISVNQAKLLRPKRSYPDHSFVSFQSEGEEITMVLAETIAGQGSSSATESEDGVTSFRVTGFIEGDRIEIAKTLHMDLIVYPKRDQINPRQIQIYLLATNSVLFTQAIADTITEISLSNGSNNIPLKIVKINMEENQKQFIVEIDSKYYDYNINISRYKILKIRYKQSVIVTVTDIKRELNQTNNRYNLILCFSPEKTEYTFTGKKKPKADNLDRNTVGETEEYAIVTNITDTSLRRIKSYCVKDVEKIDGRIKEITIAEPGQGDSFSITHSEWTSESLHGIVTSVSEVDDIVYLEENYLVYSDDPDITVLPPQTSYNDPDITVLPPQVRYLLNTNPSSTEVHDLYNMKPQCNIDDMLEQHKRYIVDLKVIQKELTTGEYDYCAYCFGKNRSRR